MMLMLLVVACRDYDDEKDHNLNAIMSMNTHDMLIYEPTYCT